MWNPDRAFVTSATGPQAFALADQVRLPFLDFPDTAGLVYGINGVCHQTANLYLSVAHGFRELGQLLMDEHGVPRPRAYWLSVLAFGSHGVFAPNVGGLGSYNFYRDWRGRYFPGQPFADVGEMAHALAEAHADSILRNATPEQAQAREYATMASILDYDLAGFENTHVRLLADKNRLIELDWDGQNPAIGEPLAHRLNTLITDLQTELAGHLTPEQYQALTGVVPGQAIHIVDPRIASGIA